MRNKLLKVFIISLLSVILLNTIVAEETTSDVKCNEDPSGPIKVCWEEDRNYLGQVTTESCSYEYTQNQVNKSFKTKEEAEAFCQTINSQHPACCTNKDPKYPMCAGQAVCQDTQKCTVECVPKITVTFIYSNGTPVTRTGKKGERISKPAPKNNYQWAPDPGTYFQNNNTCYEVPIPKPGTETSSISDNNFFSVKSKVFAADAAANTNCAEYIAKYKEYKRGKLINCGTVTNDSSSVSYKLEPEKDDVYCLQPGKAGPGKTCKNYVENRSFDVTRCKTQFLTDNESRVECGLAQILYETVKKTSDGNYVSNGKYKNGAITLALRLWMAKYSGGSQYGLGNLNDGEISDDPEITWVTKDNFYLETVKAIDELKDYSSREAVVKEYDTIIKKSTHQKAIKCEEKINKNKPELSITKETCEIYDAILLFKNAENVSEDEYLGGEEFIKETPKINVSPVPTSESYGSEYKIGLPEEVQRNIVEKECTKENNKNCFVQVKFYDASGKELDPKKVDVEWYCKKEYCEAKLTYKMLCDEIKNRQEVGKDYIRIYLRNWFERSGWIRFYKADVDPDKYQQMITFAFNKKYCEDKLTDAGTETYFEYPVSLECPCGDDKCNDLTNTKKLSTNCSNNNTIDVDADPTMNCIVNACKPSEQLAYDETLKLGGNVNICHIYCREDNEFYLAPKTNVYTGMRFSYNIRPTLLEEGKVNSNFKVDPKITSIVVQKKQCTSVIDYNNWKKTFDEINEQIKNEKNASVKSLYVERLNNWVNSLKTCNLYDKTIARTNAVSGISDTLKLELDYEDSMYGNTREMGKLNNSEITDTKYCTNTEGNTCYKFEEGKEVTLNGSNSTTTLKYCNSKNCDNNVVVPTNDYASFTVTSEVDFYQPYKYYSEEYSGIAVLEKDRNKEKTYVELPSYEYPVKINTKEGEYKINYKFTNIGKLDKYEYSCKYEVNPTTPIDGNCCIEYKDGSIDCSSCNNQITFRNIDLSNVFPNERENENNWTGKQDIIDEIQNSASTIFTDEENHLEYRYTLTSEGINQIKEYNERAKEAGGYLNKTLRCETSNGEFVNCQSDFLNDIKSGDANFSGVKVEKAGDN